MSLVIAGADVCPRCGMIDQVQKVASVTSSQYSELAVSMRPPLAPGSQPNRLVTARGSGGGGGNAGLIGCLAVIFLLTLPVDVFLLMAIVLTIALVAAVIGVFVVLAVAAGSIFYLIGRRATAGKRARKQAELEKERQRYYYTLNFWNQLDYCFRCHGVFLPGNEWQYEHIDVRGKVVQPASAWAFADQLASAAESWHQRHDAVAAGEER